MREGSDRACLDVHERAAMLNTRFKNGGRVAVVVAWPSGAEKESQRNPSPLMYLACVHALKVYRDGQCVAVRERKHNRTVGHQLKRCQLHQRRWRAISGGVGRVIVTVSRESLRHAWGEELEVVPRLVLNLDLISVEGMGGKKTYVQRGVGSKGRVRG